MNMMISFAVILLTDRQTDRSYNLRLGGGNKFALELRPVTQRNRFTAE